MDQLISRKDAAKILGISLAALDSARANGTISFVQYVPKGSVYFTQKNLQEYIAKNTKQAKPVELRSTYRKPRQKK